ncbi:MAG: uracil-DNA glycosylase [Candidatus Hydrogenedentes bacterium]|nr:uracil-DNA glycosylase [Candidatus Hydrogenedentota bacterium]
MDILKEMLSFVEELNSFLAEKKGSKATVSQEFVDKWEQFKPLKYVKLLENSQKIDVQKALDLINEEVKVCTKCGLHKTRTQTVFGSGNPKAQLVFVGEAPGAEEDKQGLPFVGRAGQLLTDIIVKGMKMRREDVYICNVLKCRPPNNREPNPMEVYYCEPYLLRQLEIIKPKVICALGRVAAQTLLKTTESIEKLRGKWHNYHGIPLRVTYHPAYLLRNPADKKKAWIDIQEVMKLLKGEIEVKFESSNGQSQLFS